MKKSIFLFFAAILCAMTANAQWYLRGSFNGWGTSHQFVNNVCEIELPAGASYEFKVADANWNTGYGYPEITSTSTKTQNGDGNTTFKTGLPGIYKFEISSDAKQLTVTYPEVPAPHDITVRAQVPASWTNTITAWVWTSENGSGEEVTPTKDGDYYVVTKNAGALYVIFKNGAGWNGDKNQTVDLCYTEDVCLQLNQSGSAKATATVIDCGAVSKDITVKAVVPGAWENTITAWVWPTGGEGKEVTPTKDGNWYVVTENCIELNVIFKNGTGWNGEANQTVNIEGVSENTCYQISALTKVGNKCSVAEVDCEAVIEPEAKPVDVYTVVGSSAELGLEWNPAKEANDMEKQGDGSYKKVYSNVELTSDVEWKIAKNDDWWNDPTFNQSNNTLTIAQSGIYNVTFTLSADLATATATAELLEATNTVADCFISGNAALTGGAGWAGNEFKMEYDPATETYSYTLTGLAAETAYELQVVLGGNWYGYEKLQTIPTGVENKEGHIAFTLAEAGDVTVTYHATNGINLTGNFAVPVTYDYYIAGTENLTGFNWSANGLGMIQDGELYKAIFSALPAGTFEFKITDGQWNTNEDKTHEWGYSNLGAAYEEVSEGTDGEGNPNGNIKFVTEEAKNITVIFDATAGKITFEGLTEKAPAEDVTVYFINSGEWAEVACHYWGGLNGSTWPGVQMDLTAETYEAEGWNVYKVTFPGDNTSCIFNDNKAEGATQTGNLEVHDGQYYCYENGIWYERLADVDPLDTRVYLKGDMNEWCTIEGWCDMFRKEDKSEQVAYRTVYLEEAGKTYEFKIESAGAWLSHAGAVTKDNCTDLTFEEGGNNCTITTEYVGEYLFIWDMTTNKLSVVYPDPKANPTILDLMVTNMEFDGVMTFSGSDNTYGIALNLVVGEAIEEGVFALDASSTVDFGGTLFTEVTGMIAPDMNTFASATAQVSGFYMGTYFQLNVEMSAGGSAATSVEIWDGVATPNDVTGELTISATWDDDDVYVVVSGFDYTNYECPEAWFYIGGTTWETASIAAHGPATITVEDGGVLVEGSVISGATGAQYELMVFGLLPVEETPDYTRTVAENQWGTICLPNASSSFTGATFYEVSSLDPAKGLWLDQLAVGAQLEAGKPYIFQATATEITVTYTDAAPVDDPQVGANGLTGTFTDIAAAEDGVLVGNYIIGGNKVHVATAQNDLPANRAYINAALVPNEVQAKIPGRRRVCMGENATTGFDQIVAPAGQAVKAIENGQLIIIRDGVKYNVQGQKL